MIAAPILLALALIGVPVGGAAARHLSQETSSPPAPIPAPAPQKIRSLILHVDAAAVTAPALAAALGRRLPELRLDLQPGAAAQPPSPALSTDPPDGLRAHAAIRQLAAGIYGLRLVLADGRAYDRIIEAPAADAARALAGALASLIPAIDEAQVPADEERAALPAPLAEAISAEPRPAPDPNPEPTPEPPPEQSSEPPPERSSEPTPEPSPPPKGPPEFGLSLSAGGLFGARSSAPAWRGLPLDLLLDRRGPRGLLLAFDLRLTPATLSPAPDRLRLLRVRLALGVGAALRRARFELPMLALFSVEPWQLRGPRGALLVVHTADGGPPRPLLGIALRLAPGYRIPLARGRLQLRLGAHLEATLSGEARRGLRVPRLQAPGVDPFELGGLELFGGLGLALSVAP